MQIYFRSYVIYLFLQILLVIIRLVELIYHILLEFDVSVILRDMLYRSLSKRTAGPTRAGPWYFTYTVSRFMCGFIYFSH